MLAISLPALAGNTVTQTVIFEVRRISEMGLSGSPGNLLIETASAGAEPAAATDSSSYSLTTNGSDQKITYTLSAPVTAGIVPAATRTVTLTLTDG